ncbi:MAG: hypothetical protein VX075_13000, partial [Pseudomonadota bacterium]|nr:hypothetical protein [Pseudomonadota bacterium]
ERPNYQKKDIFVKNELIRYILIQLTLGSTRKCLPVCPLSTAELASLEALEFVDIENLSIPVIREGRVDRYITISVSLEMRDQDSKELGDEAFPRLKDAVFSQLYSYFSMQQSGQSGINIAQVKARLLWAAERAIGKGHVRQVIIQGAYERKGEIK